MKKFENSVKSSIINADVDQLVPCLEDSKTGEILPTTITEIIDRKSLSKFNAKNGWYINWSGVPKDCKVFALKVKGSEEIEGLVSYKDMPENLAVLGHWAVAAPHNQGKLMGKDKKYNGVGGHLFAIIADASVKAGYDGFMYGKAASINLLKLYKDKFGAEEIGGLRFYISEEKAHELLDIYTFEKE